MPYAATPDGNKSGSTAHMHPLRIGLIGFGYAAQVFHAPLIGATAGLRLQAVASGDATKVRAALGDDMPVRSPTALIASDDIDAVVIATPNDTHFGLARAALEAGRHVVVDKPFTLTLAEARDLVRLAAARARLLSVFHNRRWDSDFLTLRRVLAAGRLGRITAMASHFDRFRPVVRARWRESDGPGAGLWMDLGPHLVDQAVQLFGVPDAIWLDQAAARDGAISDDWFHAILRWSRGPHAGLRVRLHASALAACPGPRFVVHGTRGSFSVDGLDAQEEVLKAGTSTQAIASAAWGTEQRQATLWIATGDTTVGTVRCEALALEAGAYPAYYAALRDALAGLGPNPIPADQAVVVQALLESGRHSAEQRIEVGTLA
jgi:predicted dehydrogenase